MPREPETACSIEPFNHVRSLLSPLPSAPCALRILLDTRGPLLFAGATGLWFADGNQVERRFLFAQIQ